MNQYKNHSIVSLIGLSRLFSEVKHDSCLFAGKPSCTVVLATQGSLNVTAESPVITAEFVNSVIIGKPYCFHEVCR